MHYQNTHFIAAVHTVLSQMAPVRIVYITYSCSMDTKWVL